MQPLSRNAVILTGVLALAAGCDDGGDGGGGGGGDDLSSTQQQLDTIGVATDYPEVTIDSSNAKTLADSGYSTATSIGTLGESFGPDAILTGVASDAGAPVPDSVAAVTLTEIRKALAYDGGAVAGALTTESAACDSGSVSVSVNDNNGNDELDAVGESITVDYDACSIAYNGQVLFTIDGGLSMSVSTFTGDPSLGTGAGTDWSYGMSVDYDHFEVAFSDTDTMAIDGGFTVEGSWTTSTSILSSRFYGDSLALVASDGGVALGDFDVTSTSNDNTGDYTYSATMTMANTVQNARFTATTTTTFEGNGTSEPTTGVMEITGSGGSTAVIDASACSATEYGLTVNNGTQTCETWG